MWLGASGLGKVVLGLWGSCISPKRVGDAKETGFSKWPWCRVRPTVFGPGVALSRTKAKISIETELRPNTFADYSKCIGRFASQMVTCIAVSEGAIQY